jgi:hypothetical protein
LKLIGALLAVDRSDATAGQLTVDTVHRLVSKRSETRALALESLAALSSALAPAQHLVLFQALRRELTEGYKVPLLYVCLKTVVENAPGGSFDGFVGLLCETLLDDIFGASARLRSELRGVVPEAQTCVTFATVRAVAARVDFREGAIELARALAARFDRLCAAEQERGARLLIESACAGLAENVSASARAVCGLASELLARSPPVTTITPLHDAAVEFGCKYREDALFARAPAPAAPTGAGMLASLFAAQMLEAFFVRELFDAEDSGQMELLGELFPAVLAFARGTRDTDALASTARTLCHFSALPCFENRAGEALEFVADSVARLPSAADVVGRAVLALLTALLERFPTVALRLSAARALVSFCHAHLDIAESCDSVFGVLVHVISRRRDIPEVYDTAGTAFELMVRARSDAVRKRSSALCADFLCTYDMADSGFRDRLQFALENLSASRASARRALLSFLRKVIIRASEQRVAAHAELQMRWTRRLPESCAARSLHCSHVFRTRSSSRCGA